MRLTFIGAAHEVTGSCYFLEGAGKKFLVDCGMEQGPDQYENQEIPVPLSEIDFCCADPCPYRSFREFSLSLCQGIPETDLRYGSHL